MSILSRENKCLFKIACALSFGLTLALTACDGGDKVLVQLDDPGAETPSPATNSPSKIGDLVCSDSMEVDGRYLEVISTQPPKESETSYYKCENGKWISVSYKEISVADDLVLEKCLGTACSNTRTLADFRKCNAKNEGLVDSTVDLDGGVDIDFYICKDNEWVYDDEAACDASLRDFEPDMLCDESYEIDGAYYEYVNSYLSSCTRFFKCENNKWSLVPKGKTLSDDATVIFATDRLTSPKADRGDILERVYFKKCNAENEGLLDSAVHEAENPKYGVGYKNYYRCEEGSWIIYDSVYEDACKASNSDEDGSNIVCDTAGVSVGAICTKPSCYRTRTTMGCTSMCFGNDTYLYMGDGVWTALAHTDDYGNRSSSFDSSLAQWTKECTAKNEGKTEKHVYGIAPDVFELYYKCVDGEWTDMSETDYYCTTEKTDIGDTCSFTVGDSTRHYMFMNEERYWGDTVLGSKWVESIADPELGYCPQTRAERRYAQKDGKNYYCEEGGWLETSLVPRQNTDSRKEGLTDEEYDVLDLPKDAKVGDRAGGLLESCSYDVEMDLGGPDEWRYETYDFCMPKNYYRYREDGTWTLEKVEELENDERNGAPECTPESEGVEYSYLPKSRDPGRNYKRISVECKNIRNCYCDDELVEYVFGRSEKK